jgi:hypothetical protein
MKSPAGQGGASDLDQALKGNILSSPAQHLRQSPRFHRLTERLHALGPRPVGELLLKVVDGRDLIEALEEYAKLDPAAVARLGGRDWPPAMWRAA